MSHWLNCFKQHWIVLVITAFFVVTNSIWIYQDTSPPLWDMAGHSLQALNIAQHFTFDSNYPPLTYLFTATAFKLFGYQVDIPQYSLLFWVILGAVALYGLTWKLYANRLVAAGSLVIFFCTPLVAHLTRIYDLDFPLTAWVMATLCALVYTNYFTKRSWAILTGLALSAALLTKWTAMVFIAAPLLYYCYVSVQQNQSNWKSIGKHILLVLLCPLILAAPWYIWHVNSILAAARQSEHSWFWTNQTWWFYGDWLIRGLSWPVAITLLAGIIVALVRRQWIDWFVLIWLVTGFLAMTVLFQTKDSRFILPMFPAVAILISTLLLTIKTRVETFTLPIAICLFPVLIWLQTSWHLPLIYDLQDTYGWQTITAKKPYYGFTYPTQPAINYPKLIQTIPVESDTTLQIAVVPNSLYLNALQFQYYMALAGNTNAIDYSLSSRIRQEDWKILLPQADYIITKTGDQGPPAWGANLDDIAGAEQHPKKSIFKDYKLIETKLAWPTLEDTTPVVRVYYRQP